MTHYNSPLNSCIKIRAFGAIASARYGSVITTTLPSLELDVQKF